MAAPSAMATMTTSATVIPGPAPTSDEDAPQRRHDRRQSGYHAAVSHLANGAGTAPDADATPVQLQVSGGSFALEVLRVGRRRRVVVQERVQALGRGQGVRLKVGLDGWRQWQGIDGVDTGPPDDRPAAEFLQRENLVRAPDPFHSVPVQSHPGQLTERFSDIEITQRGNLEAGHLVPGSVQLGLLGGDLPFERQMQPIPYQHFGDSRCVLFDFLQPPAQPVEAPFVGYVVHQDDALGAAGVGPDDGAEATLAGSVPHLQFDAFAVQQDCGGFVRSCGKNF